MARPALKRGAHRAEAAADPGSGGLAIGALAERAGVTPEAVRYYEREGVIPPAARTGAGRYRTYGEADAERLRFVRRARDLGFSLDEVRELLALAAGERGRPCAEVNRIAGAHLATVDAKLAQLGALRTELARLVAACDRDAALADCSLLAALNGASGPGAECDGGPAPPRQTAGPGSGRTTGGAGHGTGVPRPATSPVGGPRSARPRGPRLHE